jgi:DNA (cytosine-5)-methyltransferase 1
MKILSLYAGMGGFDLGAVQAGLTIERAYEIDPAACALYEKVVGAHIERADLTKIDPATLPDTDGIIGGVPCQPFSRANSARLGEFSTCNLWPTTLQIVEDKRPAWLAFENVPCLVQGHRDYFESVLLGLRDFGYRVEWRILNAADYGVPQTRRRVFIVGRRDGAPIVWPIPTHFERGVPNDPLFPRWNSWYSVTAHLIPTLHPDTLPAWITKKYQGKSFEAMPSNGWFPGQEMRHDCQHRDRGQPAFTVVASAGARLRLMVDGRVYRADLRALSAVQCLPDVGALHSEPIGNAVPPPLARAVLSQFAEVTP